MDNNAGQRQEQRFTYRWPIWFSEDLTKAVFLGLMEDVSSGGVAFTYTADHGQVREGQRLTVRFSIPRFEGSDPQGTVGVTRSGQVRWVAAGLGGTNRVGVQFDAPLSLKLADEAVLATMCHHIAL
jgi:hypothetical protein